MCGIAGVLSRDGGRAAAAPLAAMLRAVAHRGPDGQGTWLSPSGHAHLATARLAVLDLSTAGQQPMTVDGGRLAVTFNGAIYNFRELRRTLEQRGITFATTSDTEVVLRAYDVYGDACVEHLRGMFAFALWDQAASRCLLARDRLGIKPLYYALPAGRFVFGSETQTVIASGIVPTGVDAHAMFGYFRTGSVAEPRTLHAAVRSLAAGHVGVWHDGQFTTRRYWQLGFDALVRPAEAVAVTRRELIDAVQHHFVSDVPVGVFLSGGIDSTALLALAAQAGHAGLHAFTMGLPGTPGDESGLAAKTARHFGARHVIHEVDAEGGRQLLRDTMRAMDQPSIDGMNTLAIAQFARRQGMKVMLSGLGADELFGGYPSWRGVPRLAAWQRRLAAMPPVRAVAVRVLERSSDSRARRLGDLLAGGSGLARAYETYRGIFTTTEARQLTQHYLGSAPIEPESVPPDCESSPGDTVARLEMTRYLRNQLLRDSDVMSMTCGVELRLPYLDAQLVDTVTRIAAPVRLARGKALLKNAVPEIPAWVSRQPKRGFMFPVESWLQGSWRGTFAAVEERCPVSTGTWYRKWCVYALEEWMTRHV